MALTLVRNSPTLLRADTQGRTVHGTLVPFGEQARVNDGAGEYVEQFMRGAFTKTIAQRGRKVALHTMHDAGRALPVGRATHLEETEAGLEGAFYVPKTQRGDDLLTSIEEGLAGAFSIGFSGVGQRIAADGSVIRTEVILREVSVVHSPAYSGALIGGVRSIHGSTLSRELAQARLDLQLQLLQLRSIQ